jgi:two-component system phosphate regulon sensor histidine kinase PhoR
MGTVESRVLVVAPRPGSGDVAAPLQALGCRLVAADVAGAMVELAATGARALVVDDACSDAELLALVDAGRRHGIAAFLGQRTADAAGCRRALAAGCRGVLAATDDTEQARTLLAVAQDEQHRHALERQDFRALQSRYESLRQRCVQQAERFQETQETFFLDLSRVMTIISNIMDGIVFVDRDGNVTLLNPVAEDLLGVKAFAAVGKPLASLSGRAELLTALCTDHGRMAQQREVTQTVEVHHTEQDLLYIKCITSRVFDYRGQPAGSLSLLKDVTAEFKSDQLKNQYLSIVAHELRTPLTGIKTFSTMMVKGSLGPLTERQRRVVESIREQSVRLEHQIDKLINLGHLEGDEYGQDRETFSVGDFTNGLLLPFEQPARDRQIELQFACTVDAADQLYADRADLRRACMALIENAVKFTPDGGRVEVSVDADAGGQPRFRVKDTGIGIDPRYHRRIFEKFFQVEDPLTRHHGGAGLGLFVAKGIVEAHGSRIEVSSRLGSGAEFSFALPVHAAAATLAAAAPRTE